MEFTAGCRTKRTRCPSAWFAGSPITSTNRLGRRDGGRHAHGRERGGTVRAGWRAGVRAFVVWLPKRLVREEEGMDPVLTPMAALAAYKAFQKAHPHICKAMGQLALQLGPTVVNEIEKKMK